MNVSYEVYEINVQVVNMMMRKEGGGPFPVSTHSSFKSAFLNLLSQIFMHRIRCQFKQEHMTLEPRKISSK